MDFQDFGIDERLAAAIKDCGTSLFFFEKLLSRSLKNGENVCARIALDAGREEVILLPALQWFLSASDGKGRKVLAAVPDPQGARRIADAARRIGGGAGIDACVMEGAEDDPESPASAVGDPAAPILAGTPESLLAASAAGLVKLRDYGFLIVDGAERLAERPAELMRKFAGSLLPSWERRSLLACSRITVKAKNLAWDLSDNPCEISVEEEVAKAQSVAKETWRVAADTKLRFLLGYIAREKPARLCVFCNLKDTAEELAMRLEANGIASDRILGALAAERKLAVLEKAEAGRLAVLILTDAGAEGLPPGRFPLVLNYDFPLEPEYFVKRLEMLDRSAEGARVVSLVCDRYVYGLPAVESYIDATLEAAPVDDSLLSVEDKSSRMSFERGSPARDDRGRDEGRGPRYGGREERGRRDGGRRDGYREDRRPDIRRSISEATGGSLDVGGEAAPERPRDRDHDRARPAEGRAAGGRRQGSSGAREGRGADSRPPRGGAQRDGRGPDSRGSRSGGSRSGDGRGQNRNDRGRREDRPAGNPYELPMEERMKMYREKYGQRVAGPSKRGTGPGRPQARNEGGGKPASGESQGPRSGQAKGATPPSTEAMPGRSGDGLLGKFLGSLRRKG